MTKIHIEILGYSDELENFAISEAEYAFKASIESGIDFLNRIYGTNLNMVVKKSATTDHSLHITIEDTKLHYTAFAASYI